MCSKICMIWKAELSYSDLRVTPETQSTCWMTIIYRVHNRETSKEDWNCLSFTEPKTKLSNKQKARLQDWFSLPPFDVLKQKGKN